MQQVNRLGFIELLGDARLSDMDMAYMNAARREFEHLANLIRLVVIPAVGGCRPRCRRVLSRPQHEARGSRRKSLRRSLRRSRPNKLPARHSPRRRMPKLRKQPARNWRKLWSWRWRWRPRPPSE